jgi:hypothetical protein
MAGLATLEGVELASVGAHDCMTGTWDCTAQDITDAVAASQEPEWRAPIIKLGHTDPRFDGEPAVGTIRNLRASPDGRTLIGDLTGLPQWLADTMPSAYPSRSVEGVKKDIAASGRAYSFRLSALALLGVEPPAIESLADIARLYDVAAANSQQATGYGSPIVTVGPMTPVAASAAKPTPSPKGAGMTPEQIREALGLKPDASEIETAAKLASLGLIPKIADEEAAKAVAKADADAKAAADAAAKADADAKAAGEAGDDILNHPVVSELRTSLADLTSRLAARDQADKDAEADNFVLEAVSAGRLRPAERDHFIKLYSAAPEVTREIIMARARGSEVPIAPAGHAGSPEGGPDADFEAAIPDPGKGF